MGGCWSSSPHSSRRYRDPGDLDEVVVPLRYFGTNRVGSNLIPDDIDGLPATNGLDTHLALNKNVILYEAEIDHGKGYRCMRPGFLCFLTPFGLAWLLSQSIFALCSICTCDEMCQWVRKEYSTRTYFRIYANRIETNEPQVRFPYGYLGCGSWNADSIIAHPFDRGAFGFQHVRCGSVHYLCCCWPVYGGVVARQRCQCNGPLWDRMFTDCGGWWCGEWLCQIFFCSYQYRGLVYPDEVAFAASIALQAYFEGRALAPADMTQCVQFWRDNISERHDPVGRKRPVCCEPYVVPVPTCVGCYKRTHPDRTIPYADDEVTEQMKEVYDKYGKQRLEQIRAYEDFFGLVQNSTACRSLGCRRCSGRQGFWFCSEGFRCGDCNPSDRKAGDPAPPFDVHEFDDEFDASSVLVQVLGPPPPNVAGRRWRYDPETGENYLHTYPENLS